MARNAIREAHIDRGPAIGLDSLLGTLRTALHEFLHPYRPELHYMRGPGPAWRAKHAAVPVEAPVAGPALRRAAF